MAINFISVKCPDCGAHLDVEEGRSQLFCSYCGAKIMVQNDNEYIYRHIDEADLKQAETDQYVQIKKMEMAEKRRIADERTKNQKIIISLTLGIVGIIMMTLGYLAASATGDPDSGFYTISLIGFFPLMGAAYIWLFSKDKDDEDDYLGDKIRVPSGVVNYEDKSYVAIEAMFVDAGFTNIKCVPLNDLTVGLLKKPSMVESITIRGREISSGGKKFSSDAPVLITYHSYRQE